MPKKKRIRRVHSVSNELLAKSREAALSAVQIFNSPMISFKSETFIVLMNIAWTYLLHAYYRKHGVEYRYYKMAGQRRKFDKTKNGANKHWELERCLNNAASPIDKDAANNLRFLIGIRHEIEHQMTGRLEPSLSAKFQACCLNYNEYVKKLFGNQHGIEQYLAFSLQFSSMGVDQAEALPTPETMPAHIKAFIDDFQDNLSDAEFNNPRFAYRVLFVAKTANRKGQADEVIEFVRADSELASAINAKYAVIKETERPKHLPSRVVQMMKDEGYVGFSMYNHTQLWKVKKAKNAGKGFGVEVEKSWYWYDSWIDVVRQHCKAHQAKYKKAEVRAAN